MPLTTVKYPKKHGAMTVLRTVIAPCFFGLSAAFLSVIIALNSHRRGPTMPSIATTAVHAGHLQPKPGTPSAPPIVLASGWTYPDMESLDAALGDPQAGFVYSRNAAPTQEAFEAPVPA